MNASCEPAVASRVVHFVVPEAIDDPLRPSGGNRYDQEIRNGLVAAGWQVHLHPLPDAWPQLGGAGSIALAQLLPRIPDGALVLVDGLIALASGSVLVPDARRISLVVLVHAAANDPPGAADVLVAARRVIATSRWLGDELQRGCRLPAGAVAVAVPGVDAGTLAAGTRDGGELLCVGAIAPHKGQDLLLAALAELADQHWRCRCVGGFDHDPAFARRLCAQVRSEGLADRVTFTGPRRAHEVDAFFASADVLVHPTRTEGYGMVITEALAHGLPVIAADTGGSAEALGTTTAGELPGMLVPPNNARALARAISTWLSEPALRSRLRDAARSRRRQLPSWPATAQRIADVLESTP